VFQVFRELIERVDRIGSASRHTGAAVDAAAGIYEKLGSRFEGWLVFFGMDALGGAGADTKQVLDAGIGDHVSNCVLDRKIGRVPGLTVPGAGAD